MLKYLHVRVVEIRDDAIVFTLPNDVTLEWPLHAFNAPESLSPGDELILSLSQQTDILNELLMSDEDKDKNS